MTREESKKYIKSKMCNNCSVHLGGGKCSDNCKVIEAIKTLEQELCINAVSRQVIKEQMIKYGFHAPDMTVTEFVEDLPPVNPTKIGHWINAKVGKLFPSNDFKCSECGNILDFNGVNCGRGDANYCPNCGVKMVEPQERSGEK